jgi:flavin reductase (DIM6/NTAB) family NADH-FMN oxidoreductase RutF
MECETVKIYEGGDHQIFLGQVQNAEVLQNDHPLLYFRGKYRTVNMSV